MRRDEDCVHIRRLFWGIISSIGIILVLAVILSFLTRSQIYSKNIKDKNVVENKVEDNSVEKEAVVDVNKKYNVKEEPKVNVYFMKQKKVRAIPLEEYVRGVVSAEMPVEFNEEALKAQAVAARTYALAHMKNFGDNQFNERINADVCDTIYSQVYMPKDKRLKAWPKNKRNEYWNKIDKSVKSTSGQILVYNGDIVMSPYYFATSNGKTEDCENVFKSKVPYLKSVSSPGEEKAPKFKTSAKFSYNEFIKKVNSQYPKSGLSTSKLKNQVKILSKSDSGSVKTIKIGNITITGPNFRKLLSLNSSKFTIDFKGSNILINCNGYGHNVGMSQWGANSMGKDGKKYEYILKHYYSGVNIKKLNY
ncbi:stage II sporulation protein D [Clostridium oceanicum]|uniref:Stage II sporulation protein D n=1 Tax=Clostridium oceanicum TaxID=1543 RepID=A0ABP3V0F1_9CLOT